MPPPRFLPSAKLLSFSPFTRPLFDDLEMYECYGCLYAEITVCFTHSVNHNPILSATIRGMRLESAQC